METKKIRAADPAAPSLKKKGVILWAIQDHICRKCFGRIISAPEGTQTRFKCTNCGYEVVADDVSAMCCCGIKYKRGGRKGSKDVAPVNAGIRCIRNPNPTTEFCCEIVASEVAYAK